MAVGLCFYTDMAWYFFFKLNVRTYNETKKKVQSKDKKKKHESRAFKMSPFSAIYYESLTH